MSSGYNHFNGTDSLNWTLGFTIAQSDGLFRAFIRSKGKKEVAVVAHMSVGATVDNEFCQGQVPRSDGIHVILGVINVSSSSL